MAINRTTARRLCTADEYDLFEASTAAAVKQLTPARLRQKVQRARRLRDKYRDLARRQRLESRGKTEPRGARAAAGHQNTDRKARLFQEVLERFEARLGTAGGAARRDGGSRKTGAKKAGAKKAGAKKTGAKKTGAKKTGAKKAGAKKAGVKKAGAAAKQKSAREPRSDSPAAGQAKQAPPGHTGPTAMKGARGRPEAPARTEASQVGRQAVARSHARASNRRGQERRDRRP